MLSIGVWDFTAAFDDLIETTSLGNPVQRHDNRGAYAGFEDPIWSREEHDPFDLAGFVRAGIASDDVNPIASYFGLGLVVTGPFEARPADKLGVALAIANVGDKYRTLIQASSGSAAAREINFEMTYQLPLMDGVVVQPDLQWINNPGANASIRDAFVVGVRFKVDHNWSD